MPRPSSGLCLEAWEALLPWDYPQREFLLKGIKDGFSILDADLISTPVESENYRSTEQHADKVQAQIKAEYKHGHYVMTPEKPDIISALGAIPKKNSDNIRLIHDCSRPPGNALNDFAFNNKFRYQSLQDAIDYIQSGDYLAKIDLAQAYRVVKIHPSNYRATGLKFKLPGMASYTYFYDTHLPFGARKSPEIFNALSQAVRVIMQQLGYERIIVFLDDFLIIESSKEKCAEAMRTLIRVLRCLGFWINYKKVDGPGQHITFLGIHLNTIDMTMELPPDKLNELQHLLSKTKARCKITKRGLQSLAGKLNWASQCIYGGRFHLRRIFDTINTLDKPWHRTRITASMRHDVDWWLSFLRIFNGKMEMVDPRPLTPVYIDACPVAAGGYYAGDIVYTPWQQEWPQADELSITYKEVSALEPAVMRWGPLWQNKKVIVHTDNMGAMAIINKGSCKNPVVMDSLRRIFWWSALYNFRLHAVYIKGTDSMIADAVSRLHEPNGVYRLIHNLHWLHNL